MINFWPLEIAFSRDIRMGLMRESGAAGPRLPVKINERNMKLEIIFSFI